MNWTEQFIKAIEFIEDNLLNDISLNDIGNKVGISPFYFERGFSIYSGYNVKEYIRNRRLYKAALEIKSSNVSITELAFKYHYETLESFSKAFLRFHGCTPTQLRNNNGQIKLFLPLKINISISGGNDMDYIVEKEKNLKFIGFKKTIKGADGYIECPKFWDELIEKYLFKKNDGSSLQEAIHKNKIGAFAVCYNTNNEDHFDYYICGKYEGGEVPKPLEVIEMPESLWAKFKCVGPLSGSLQAVNTAIYRDWLPNNDKYELNICADIEYYHDGDTSSDDYVSEIWLPIKEK